MAEIALSLTDADLERLADLLAERVQPAVSSSDAPKLFYSEEEAASALSISKFTLKKWREDGLVTAATRQRPIVYRWADIEQAAAYMERRN